MNAIHRQLGLGKTATIQLFVAGYYGCPVNKFLSPCREKRVSHPRQVAMYLTRQLTNQSLPQIGRKFDRDHTTVLHALGAVEDRIEHNPRIAKDVSILREALLEC